MFAKLTALVSSGYTFPYVLKQQYGVAWGSWTHHQGAGREDGTPVSVFRISAGSKTDPNLEAARNGVKRLRMVRHPNVLAFKDTAEVEEKGVTVIYLVTEPVTPLVEVLSTMDLQASARDEYVAMGLYHIAKAVGFLNNDCKVIHGNISLRAVVVTETLDWRLHGFDLMSDHQSPSHDLPLIAAAWMVGAQYKPGELAKMEWDQVAQSPPWAVDAWGLGCLMQEAFSGQQLARTEDLRNTDRIPKPLLQDYQRLLSSQPSRRLNPAKLAESSVLKNKLVDMIAFLENLAVKDSMEKDQFFKRLPPQIPSLPVAVAQRKLLPMLASALEFGGAPSTALAALLQIGQTLEAEEFTKRVVPSISKLFASSDRTIRRSLLENIDTFGPTLTQSVVEEQIYPAVATGFSDGNAYLRELTLKSMLVLAPKLTQRTLNQSLLKFLAKLQVDEEPPIRANTTILLGNLAQHLSEAACKRVLLNAFTRALKDNFPPARVAGLKAMMATASLHSPEEAAQRVLPAVCPLAIDPISEVRHTALAAMDAFTKVLKDHNVVLTQTAESVGQASKDLQQGSAAGGWSVGIGSNLGWAMSSFGLARGGKGEVPTSGVSSSGPSPGTAATSSIAAPQARPADPSRSTAGGAAVGGSSGAGGETSGDGWDDDEALEGLEDAEEAEARQRLSRLATRPAAASRPEPVTTSTSGGWGSGSQAGEDDRWEDKDQGSPRSATSFQSASSSGSGLNSGRAPAGGGGRGRGRGGGIMRKPATSKPGAMKLGAQKLSLGKVDPIFDI
ncbi:hypothetical protein WJX72_008245 [[Myrmecia] bisecta]|uniref:Protein kinase domain-containing protein n=1 Tax=[Myrmecia] bisecta TaxID=41462 RepID=A0AAW1PA90_9CHLO